MKTCNLPPLREVIRRHGLNARKSLGQHFILDPNLTNRITRTAGALEGYNVIEIGPGPGGLTRALLDSAAKSVIVVEKDPRCLTILKDLQRLSGRRLQIINSDALELDLPSITPMPRKIVANLPYNIATALLLKCLREFRAYDRLTLMFQLDVAERLIAKPSTKAYGRLSVVAQWLCEVKSEFNISKNAFTPPPKVTSTISTLIPRSSLISPINFESMELVTAAAFGQRRKMLRSSLKSLELDLNRIGIDPTARAEELSIRDFCNLAQALEYQRKMNNNFMRKGSPNV